MSDSNDGANDPLFQEWKQKQYMSWMFAVPSGKVGYELYKGKTDKEREDALELYKEELYQEKREQIEKERIEKERIEKEKEYNEYVKDGICHSWVPQDIIKRKCQSGTPFICSLCHKELFN